MPSGPRSTEPPTARHGRSAPSDDVLGQYVDDAGTCVVRLIRGASSEGLGSEASGAPVRFEPSAWTRDECSALKQAVVTIAEGKGNFGVGYDARTDRVRVDGYFPEESVVAQLRQLDGVDVVARPRYDESDEDWAAGNQTFRDSAASLLGRWSNFPADQQPRPIVMVGPAAWSTGRPVDLAAQEAFQAGAIQAAIRLPAGLREMIAAPCPPAHPDPLLITSVTADRADFLTDRGPQNLPAYLVDVSRFERPFAVLDPTVPVWSTPSAAQLQRAHRPPAARVDPDGMTIHRTVSGDRNTEFGLLEVWESPSAVLTRPITRVRNGPMRLSRVHRELSATLAAPLGGRVLLDENADAMAVIPRQ
jgi:hypothetical protein